jgi:DNA invertase Pin-like site-specific DNA recombinase
MFGVPNPAVFREGPKSGALRVPEVLDDLLEQVRQGAIKTVIVAEANAVSRITFDLVEIWSSLDRYGAELYLASGQRCDPTMLFIIAQAEFERSRRSALIKAGKAAAKERGRRE